MEESRLQTSSECNHYNSTMFTIVVAVRGFSGALSFLASLSVILLILVLRKYHFFVQRLIIYLGMASAMNGLSKALQVGYHHPVTQTGRDYCNVTAFLDQVSEWSVFLSTLVITIHLYIKAVHNKTVKLEGLCLIVIFVVPLSFNWVPFIYDAYGQAGPWCWITLYDPNCNKNKFGMILRIVLWSVPSIAILIIIIILYLIMLISLSRQKHQYKAQYNPQQDVQWDMKKKEVRVLILYPLALFLVEVPAIISRIIEMFFPQQKISPALWFIYAFLTPLQGGLVCLAYAMDPETRARLRKCSWRAPLQHRIINEYPAERGLSDSITEETQRLLTLKRPRPRESSSFISGYEQTTFKTFEGKKS